MMLVSKVPIGSSMDVRTIGWAAMCRTRSKSRALTTAETASRLRRSARREAILRSTPAMVNNAGAWSGGNARPVTSAPIRLSQMAAHEPLKPVWPVKRTRLPAQKRGFTAATAPRRTPTAPQVGFVAQRVHGGPEAVVAIGHELAVGGQTLQGFLLPHRGIVVDPIHHLRVEDEEAAIDQAVVPRRLLDEPLDPSGIDLQRAIAPGRRDRGDRRILAVALVEVRQRPRVDVGHAVAIGQEEGLPGFRYGATRFSRPPVIVASPVSTRVTRHGSWLVAWYSTAPFARSTVRSALWST